MKQSYKFREADIATVRAALAQHSTVTAAAKSVGLHESTLHRWLRSGKIPGHARVRRQSSRPRSSMPKPGQSATAWARSIRHAYTLTPTEAQILDLACRALAMAQDETGRPDIRLTAMTKFSMLVQRLNLEVPADGDAEKETAEVRSWPRRVS